MTDDIAKRRLLSAIHQASVRIRGEYPELRNGDASGGRNIEFWNELVHRCAGALLRDDDGAEVLAEADQEARRLQVGSWQQFLNAIEFSANEARPQRSRG
jgi:hypothetical protein